MKIARIVSGAVVLEEDRIAVVRDDADCKVVSIDSPTKYYNAGSVGYSDFNGGEALIVMFDTTDETLYAGADEMASLLMFEPVPNPEGRTGRWVMATETGRYETTVVMTWVDKRDAE